MEDPQGTTTDAVAATSVEPKELTPTEIESEQPPTPLPCCSSSPKKAGLLVFSLLYIPLFAGAFFGFGPMQIMLEETGAFASVCPESTTTEDKVCPDQTARLLTM